MYGSVMVVTLTRPTIPTQYCDEDSTMEYKYEMRTRGSSVGRYDYGSSSTSWNGSILEAGRQVRSSQRAPARPPALQNYGAQEESIYL